MKPAITFLSVEDALTIHEDTIANEGGLGGVRDFRLLDSAVMMPQQTFGGEYLHDDVAAMAAAYLFHIAQNHPFNDGNKRTAVAAALVFLCGNGVNAPFSPDALRDVTISVAAGDTSKEELIGWMRDAMAPKCTGEQPVDH